MLGQCARNAAQQIKEGRRYALSECCALVCSCVRLFVCLLATSWGDRSRYLDETCWSISRTPTDEVINFSRSKVKGQGQGHAKRENHLFGHNFWTKRRREVRLGSKCSGTNGEHYKIIKVKVSWKKSPTAEGQISRSKVKKFKMVRFQKTFFCFVRKQAPSSDKGTADIQREGKKVSSSGSERKQRKFLNALGQYESLRLFN